MLELKSRFRSQLRDAGFIRRGGWGDQRRGGQRYGRPTESGDDYDVDVADPSEAHSSDMSVVRACLVAGERHLPCSFWGE